MATVHEDEWRPVRLACCEPEERWVGGEIQQLAGPDPARPVDHVWFDSPCHRKPSLDLSRELAQHGIGCYLKNIAKNTLLRHLCLPWFSPLTS